MRDRVRNGRGVETIIVVTVCCTPSSWGQPVVGAGGVRPDPHGGAHVSEFVALDVSATMDLWSRLRASRGFADVEPSPEQMVHGIKMISNFGVFGVDSGTQIVNLEETAILGVGTITRRPWVVGEGADDPIEPR